MARRVFGARHAGQHLTLAWRERGRDAGVGAARTVALPLAAQQVHERRCRNEHLAGRRMLDRFGDLSHARRLQQIATRAGIDSVEEIVRDRPAGEHDDRDPWMAREDPRAGLRAGAIGELVIHEHDVGQRFIRKALGFGDGRGRPGYHDARAPAKHVPQALAERRVVVDDQHPHVTHRTIVFFGTTRPNR